MQRVLTTWLYDEDPFKLLAFEAPLDAIKARLANNNCYFESLIQTHLLDNLHRTTLRFKPDPEFARRFEEDEKSRLADDPRHADRGADRPTGGSRQRPQTQTGSA